MRLYTKEVLAFLCITSLQTVFVIAGRPIDRPFSLHLHANVHYSHSLRLVMIAIQY
jgi:hypothetical protein